MAAVNQSSKSGQLGKFRADHEGPVMARSVSTRPRPEADFRSRDPGRPRSAVSEARELTLPATSSHPIGQKIVRIAPGSASYGPQPRQRRCTWRVYIRLHARSISSRCMRRLSPPGCVGQPGRCDVYADSTTHTIGAVNVVLTNNPNFHVSPVSECTCRGHGRAVGAGHRSRNATQLTGSSAAIQA